MKMVMVAYNEAIDADVLETLAARGLVNYTKLTQTLGRGTASGTHGGNDVWPGLNNVLLAAVPDEAVRPILDSVRELRRALGGEGVKAFVLPVEDLT